MNRANLEPSQSRHFGRGTGSQMAVGSCAQHWLRHTRVLVVIKISFLAIGTFFLAASALAQQSAPSNAELPKPADDRTSLPRMQERLDLDASRLRDWA